MNSSEHVLVVFGYYHGDERLLFRLQGVQSWCKLSIAYCCCGTVPFYLMTPLEIVPYRRSLEQERQESLIELRTLGAKLGVPNSRQYLVTGFLHQEVRRLALKLGATTVVGASAHLKGESGVKGFWNFMTRHIHGGLFA